MSLIPSLKEENSRLLAANKDLQLNFDVLLTDLRLAERENSRLRNQVEIMQDVTDILHRQLAELRASNP